MRTFVIQGDNTFFPVDYPLLFVSYCNFFEKLESSRKYLHSERHITHRKVYFRFINLYINICEFYNETILSKHTRTYALPLGLVDSENIEYFREEPWELRKFNFIFSFQEFLLLWFNNLGFLFITCENICMIKKFIQNFIQM